MPDRPDRAQVEVLRYLASHGSVDVAAVLDFLGAHAVPGLETYVGAVYTRVVEAPGGPALVALSAADGGVEARIRLSVGSVGVDGEVDAIATRCRALLDLDTDPSDVDDALGADADLGPLVARRPGLRAPGSVDGFETAVRTVVGQQISLAGARTVLGRIVADHGRPAFDGWMRFPTAERLASLDPSTLPMPRARGRSVQALSAAVADGRLVLDDTDADQARLRADLLALPGIGPWSADYLAMRVFGDRDVLLASDLVVKRAAAGLGIELSGGRPHWAPLRTYATYHLWAHLVADRWRAQR